ncbi:Hsp70 family protein [Bacteroidales bacterium OttesenSCG-928-B11]|nr:Hsp70 family protein [Bacteroidales bacterium OttesenSCG-928-B11]
MGKSIGIDLGTTNSVIGFKDTTVRIIRNNNNEELTRSCVALSEKKEFLVGNKVFNNMQKYIPNVVTSIKRLMGNSVTNESVKLMQEEREYYPYEITNLSSGTEDTVAVVLQGIEYTPEQISAEILRQLKNDASEKLGEEVTHAVITVPAYFNEKQKTATRIAANIAGLKVKRLLAEPTAAAISYGVSMQQGEGKVVLVYDFGGGTFDLSILVISDNNFIEAATGGDRWLGGDNIDKIIKQYIYDEFERENAISIDELLRYMPQRKQNKFIGELHKQIEDAKIQLTATKHTDIQMYGLLENNEGDDIDIEIQLTREKFESLIMPLVERTIHLTDELFNSSGYPIESIDHILLVGGSSCIPLIKNMLSEKYGKEKILYSEKPMLAIAEGAAILAHSLPEDFECSSCGAELDINQIVCPRCGVKIGIATQQTTNKPPVTTIHVGTHNYFITVVKNTKNTLYKVIEKSEVLPLNKYESFKTVSDNQKLLKIEISADAENGAFEKQALGFYVIEDNLPAGSEMIFELYMDVNQTLSVQVYPKGNKGKKEKVRLTRGNKDEKSLMYIAQAIENIAISNVPDMNKIKFMEDVQKQIEKINRKMQTADPSDNSWDEIERIIRQSEQEASTGNDVELGYVFGIIIRDYFSKYIDRTDLSTLNELLNRYERSNNDLEKVEISDKIKDFIMDANYYILINVFTLRLLSDSKDVKPIMANDLLNAYNNAIAALDAGNIAQVIDILNKTELPTEINIDIKTGIER